MRHRTKRLQLEALEDRRMLASQVTAEAQLLLELVNRARANPELEAQRFGIDLNENLEPGTISPDPKPPLAPSEILTLAARLHAEDMLRYDFFEHVNLKGENPSDRASKLGYPAEVGENIAWFGQQFPLFAPSQPYLRHAGLFLSEGHRENMLQPHYREMGAAVEFGDFEGLHAVMVAEEFSTRGPESYITGVAYTDHVNQDAFYSAGEGMKNMTVTAVNVESGQVYSTKTAEAGGYALMVPNGAYTVSFAGFGLDKPIEFENVFVEGQNRKVDLNLRIPMTGTLFGSVFQDKDDSGSHNDREEGLEGWTVFLDANHNGEPDPFEPQTETNEEGIFQFNNLLAGPYPVSVVEQEGWKTENFDELPTTSMVEAGTVNRGPSFEQGEVDGPPTAVDDEFQVMADQAITLEVLTNDTDAEGPLALNSITIVEPPTSGSIEQINGGRIRYTPFAGFVGTDHFAYTAKDLAGNLSNQATVTLIVSTEGQQQQEFQWQNPDNHFDVDGDTFVAPLDAAWLLSEMNETGPRELEPLTADPSAFLDVSGDGFLSPLDVMLVINELNRLAKLQSAQKATAAFAAPAGPPETQATADRAWAVDAALAQWGESSTDRALDPWFSQGLSADGPVPPGDSARKPSARPR